MNQKRPCYIWIVTASFAQNPKSKKKSKLTEHPHQHINFNDLEPKRWSGFKVRTDHNTSGRSTAGMLLVMWYFRTNPVVPTWLPLRVVKHCQLSFSWWLVVRRTRLAHSRTSILHWSTWIGILTEGSYMLPKPSAFRRMILHCIPTSEDAVAATSLYTLAISG